MKSKQLSDFEKYNLLNPYLGRFKTNCPIPTRLRSACEKQGFLNPDGSLTPESTQFLKDYFLKHNGK